MQSWILYQEPQQRHSAVLRYHSLLNDLCDRQTENYHWGHFVLERLEIGYIFLSQHKFIEQWVYGGSVRTQWHQWLIHWPIDNACYQWQKLIHTFLQSKLAVNHVRWLVWRLGNYLCDLKLRCCTKHFEQYRIKYNSCIHGNIVGSIWGW